MTKQTMQNIIGAVTRYVGPNGVISYGERVKIDCAGAVSFDEDADHEAA
jgi:hypothetical protein